MLELARVVEIHAESHCVDITMMNTNQRFAGVNVMSSMAGGDVGVSDLPEPDVTDPSQPFDSLHTNKNDMLAVVSFMNRDVPVVLGFIYPQVAQVLFKKKNFRVNRHASDVYSTIDEDGNIEIAHPSGTYIRIGETADHVDLTGLDYDAKWAIKKNTSRLPNIRLQVKNVNGVKSTFTIDPSGNTTFTTQGTMSLSSVGNMSLHTDGTMALSATGDVNITGATINLN